VSAATRNTVNLAALATRFLRATADPKFWLAHWKNRAWARNVLLRCRRPGYMLTVDAGEDFWRLVDLLAEVEVRSPQ
jgi:hypothetical protein